jgi:hypothetical protein
MEAWEPDGNGNLRAQEGDNMETLKSYLTEIHGETGISQNEWTELEDQVKELKQSSVGGDISGNTISSSTGLFENLVGAYLVTRANSDPSWGYPEDLAKGNLCSPTTFNRVDKAMEFVYGKDILGKLSNSNPIYARWNNLAGSKGVKYGEEMIPSMGYGTSVSETDILNGRLKAGAVLRMTQSPGPQNTPVSWHAVIFLNYTYDNDQNIMGLTYWQQSTKIGYINSIKFSYKSDGEYSFRHGYKPKLGANFK